MTPYYQLGQGAEMDISKVKEYGLKILAREDSIPLVIMHGSRGDEYGFVHDKSDYDVTVLTTDKEMLERNKIDWGELKVKIGGHVHPNLTVFVAEGANIGAGFSYYSKETFDQKFRNQDLETRILNFVESKPILDKRGIYNEIREETIKEFEANRQELLRKNFSNCKHLLYDKLRNDIDIYEKTHDIDLLRFNKAADELANKMIYARCMLKHIPRSSHTSLSGKRKENILKAIGMSNNYTWKMQAGPAEHGVIPVKNLKRVYDNLIKEIFEVYGMCKKEFGEGFENVRLNQILRENEVP